MARREDPMVHSVCTPVSSRVVCDPLHAFLWGGKSAVFACGGKERFM
jgi:hypothetical protein